MTREQWIALAVGLVGLFWVLGAHNRLVALRNRIGEAWALVDEQLQRRQQVLPALVDALRGPLAGEHRALDATLLAHAEQQGAAERLRQRPVQTEAALAWVAAEGALASALARLQSLVEQQAALRESTAIAAWQRELLDAGQRLGFARQLFNDAAEVYDRAARQFPTRVVARLFNFGLAGRL
jgi:LemA protein